MVGGENNIARGWGSGIGWGNQNLAWGGYSSIVGGGCNRAFGGVSSIGGGKQNTTGLDGDIAAGKYSAVGGGYDNYAVGVATVIGGGAWNSATGNGSVIGGGTFNKASDYRSTVPGGDSTQADGDYSVAAGKSNQASGECSAVGGGYNNTAAGDSSFVGGGSDNAANDKYATVGGGKNNTANYIKSTVGGGAHNYAGGNCSTVPGGGRDSAFGHCSFAAGKLSYAAGDYSFALGRCAIVDFEHDGTFVWADPTEIEADSTCVPFESTGPDQFLIRALGNVGINENSPVATFDIGKLQGSPGTIRIQGGTPALGRVLTCVSTTGLAAWEDISGVGGNTLDEAYDQGGPGSGRTINATDGYVHIAGDGGLRVNNRVAIGRAIPNNKYPLNVEDSYDSDDGHIGVPSAMFNDGTGDVYAMEGYARATTEGSSTNYVMGVSGQAQSDGPNRRGIMGDARSVTQGLSTGQSCGVYGQAFYGENAYGIYGTAQLATNNWAGYFSGNVHVNGTLSKSAGSFKIDHPLEPENRYLCHSFVESPDMMNIYNGNVITDSEGESVVELPKYFDALNKDFRYQLTVIGDFAQAIVAEEVNDGRFVIRTDKPNVKVSWQVTGIRKDAYAEANRIQAKSIRQVASAANTSTRRPLASNRKEVSTTSTKRARCLICLTEVEGSHEIWNISQPAAPCSRLAVRCGTLGRQREKGAGSTQGGARCCQGETCD